MAASGNTYCPYPLAVSINTKHTKPFNMIEEILTKDMATQCFRKKTKFYFIYFVAGILFAIYPAYLGSNKNITITLIAMVMTIIIAFIAIRLSIAFNIRSITGKTYTLDEKQLTVISKNDSYKILIPEIIKVKEGKNGLIIKSNVETIEIPNYLTKFDEFKNKLLKY
jgi:hypothetical protein